MKDFMIVYILCFPMMGFTQGFPAKSTEDLSFLIGRWDIKRTYRPESKEPRDLKGLLSCQWSLDSTFIKCDYEMERPGKKRGLDLVFFNYNTIYEEYESVWLSSTWPIKVVMHGNITDEQGRSFLYTADFPIGNGVVEHVKSHWLVSIEELTIPSFSRKTLIRTSDDEDWLYHMNEEAVKVKSNSR